MSYVFDGLALTGFVCLIIAFWWVLPSLGLGVAGAGLMTLGIMGARRWPSSNDS